MGDLSQGGFPFSIVNSVLEEEFILNDIKIVTLAIMKAMRARPGMYIGSTYNPTVILREVVDNCKDEALEGYATKCGITTRDEYCIVIDDGRGLPVYTKEDTGNTAAVDIYSSAHTGSKFDDDSGSTSIGMNGTGVKAANALSQKFVAYVNLYKKDLSNAAEWIRDAAKVLDLSEDEVPVYEVVFKEGDLVSERVIKINDMLPQVKDSLIGWEVVGDQAFGTIVYFEPDPTIWTTTKTQYNIDSLKVSMLYLEGRMEILLNGESAPMYSLHDRYADSELIQVDDSYYHQIEGDASDDENNSICRYLIQLGWSGSEFDCRNDGSVNTVSTPSGAHINACAKGVGWFLSKIDSSLDWRDAQYGMRLFTLVMTNRAVFNSQTKEHLSSIGDYNFNMLSGSVSEKCKELYDTDKSFQTLINKVIERIHEYKKLMGNMSINEQVTSNIVTGESSRSNFLRNSKVKDCNTKNREEAELYIVEGDSAAGSLVQARDRNIHAIMPLRGKSLNATSTGIDLLLENEEFKSLFNVLGAGIHPYNVQMEHLRYGKVIIASDEDPDGCHIRALLVGAFGTHLPQLIEQGKLFVAESPLYEQDDKFFLASERHLMDDNKEIIRNKGLGGLDPEDIGEFLFSSRRVLTEVTSEGLEDAIELIRDGESKREMTIQAGLVVDE